MGFHNAETTAVEAPIDQLLIAAEGLEVRRDAAIGRALFHISQSSDNTVIRLRRIVENRPFIPAFEGQPDKRQNVGPRMHLAFSAEGLDEAQVNAQVLRLGAQVLDIVEMVAANTSAPQI